ncbi:MAG: master DNA invertase Mpi family serine-type recombinase [Tissierellia bacterium]|nr:master DNA invertase Mpi family serine-type recombinase [Tissierellia bacterium]
MIYAYIRVSTEKQTVENQRLEIERFCNSKDMAVDKWIKETVSGTKAKENRRLGTLLKRMKKGDTLIISEISRLSRKMMDIMQILSMCMEKEVIVYSIKEGYELGDTIVSKVLAFAFGLSAEIERNLISQRTKEGLARAKAQGVKLGRKKGGKNAKYKLTDKEDQLIELLCIEKRSKEYIAKKLKCSVSCLNAHIKRMKEM